MDRDRDLRLRDGGGGGGDGLLVCSARFDASDEAATASEVPSLLTSVRLLRMLVLLWFCDWLYNDMALGVDGNAGDLSRPKLT